MFYRQVRVGRGNKDFRIFKFRSMRVGSDKGSLVAIGGRDPRVTRSGYFIRKWKLDELPKLINVFVGDMSLVGPRPEVRLNSYYHHYRFWKDIEIIFATVLGRKIEFAGVYDMFLSVCRGKCVTLRYI